MKTTDEATNALHALCDRKPTEWKGITEVASHELTDEMHEALRNLPQFDATHFDLWVPMAPTEAFVTGPLPEAFLYRRTLKDWNGKKIEAVFYCRTEGADYVRYAFRLPRNFESR